MRKIKNDNFYSGIRKVIEEKSEKSIGNWYSQLLKPLNLALKYPFIICSAIFVYILVKHKRILEIINQKDNNLLFLLLFCIISISAGARVYQSIYLAKIDYSTIELRKIRDTLTFTAVASFLAVALYGLLGDIIIQILYITYVAFSLVGTINFWDLFLTRLKKQEDELDYICERYIQFFNATVFSILTVLLSLFVTMTWLNLDATCSYISLATFMCVLLILNMLHSHELTFMPKIILCNDKEDNVISGFKKLKIGRMNKKDTDKIVDTIIKEFKYVFEYIFDTSDEVTLKRTLRSLVTSCFGFGFLGYMNFYSIKRSDDNREIGLIKMSTLHRCLIYSFLELLFIPIIIISQFGAGKLWQIKKRSTEIKKSQPQLQNKTEFELTYFVIYEEFRKNKYATCAADLLVKALFYSKTNNINCSRLILLVREFNHSALALFKTIGFEEYVSEKCITEPIEITSKQGKGIFFQYSKESVSAPSIKDSIM